MNIQGVSQKLPQPELLLSQEQCCTSCTWPVLVPDAPSLRPWSVGTVGKQSVSQAQHTWLKNSDNDGKYLVYGAQAESSKPDIIIFLINGLIDFPIECKNKTKKDLKGSLQLLWPKLIYLGGLNPNMFSQLSCGIKKVIKCCWKQRMFGTLAWKNGQ